MEYTIIDGIIYRIYNANVADKLVYILDKNGSKRILYAKNIKKMGSRKAYAIELGNHIRAKIAGGYKLPIITEVDLKTENVHLKTDYRLMTSLQYLCEVIDKFAQEDLDNKPLYSLVNETFQNLNSERLIITLAIFSLKLLYLTGDLPDLDICYITGKQIDSENAYYVSDHIGYITENAEIEKYQVNHRLYKTQQYTLRNSVLKAQKVNLTPDEQLKMLKLHINWIELTIGKELKSKNILISALK